MAGELYRVILHFRSNFSGKADRNYVSQYVADWIRTMQGLGQVLEVEVVYVDEVPEIAASVQERTTVPAPAPPPPSSETPAIIIEEPDTGQRTKIPGTGD